MVSALLLTNTFATGNIITDGDAMNSIDAILYHGSYPEEETEEWIILNQADMLVGPDGKDMSIAERLEDIKERYGEYSDDYLTACDIAYRIGLTAINPT